MVEILNQQEGEGQPAVIKTTSLSGKGYFPLQDVKKHELFVLIDLENLNKPFLFHYDWSWRRTRNPKDKLKQVTSISYESFRSAKIQLKGSADKSLYFPPLWMKDWKKNTPLKFDQDCKFQKINESSYKLICTKSSQSSGNNSWTQEISTKDITFPKKR